jgi:hypothetical protein
MTNAVLITQMNIPVEIEAEFNDWYTNEHVAERVDLPGFKSAFRFMAVDASPKYFAYYETESIDSLTTPTYKAILADQSNWSKKVMARFRDFGRFCGPLICRVGRGHGANALVLRAKGGEKLTTLLTEILNTSIDVPLAVTGYLWRADAEATGDASVTGQHVMVIEALDEETLRHIAASHLRPSMFADISSEKDMDVGFYRLISFMER